MTEDEETAALPDAEGPAAPAAPQPARPRRGSSLVELMVTMVVMGVLVSLGVPRFQRSLEQARADVAASNLRAIWTAQRLHWLNDPGRSYATSLTELCTENLLDHNLTASNSSYTYTDPQPDPDDLSGFLVTAQRVAGSSWSGALSINAKGQITTTLAGPGGPIVPASQ